MRVLLINALISGGGTEVQTQRELQSLKKHGHEAWLLTFDLHNKKMLNNHFNIIYEQNVLKRIFYRNRVDTTLKSKIVEILNLVKPNLIHINNLQDNAYTVLEACNGYKVIKTIRDPGMVCPKSTCLKSNLEICEGFKYGKCFSCISFRMNYQVLNYQFVSIYKQYKKVVSRFVCPSDYLTTVSNNNGLQTKCLHNPFDFSIIKKINATYKRNYLYYGVISVEKGVLKLLDAFKEFNSHNSGTTLYLVGKLANLSISDIERYSDYGVEYLGVKTQTEIMELYKNIYCVIVPSIWLENYPNTVLEALACKTLVIGSNRGGIPKMIQNEDLIFDVLNKQEMISCLSYVNNLSTVQYEMIVEDNYSRIKQNNTIESYYNTLMNIVSSI